MSIASHREAPTLEGVLRKVGVPLLVRETGAQRPRVAQAVELLLAEVTRTLAGRRIYVTARSQAVLASRDAGIARDYVDELLPKHAGRPRSAERIAWIAQRHLLSDRRVYAVLRERGALQRRRSTTSPHDAGKTEANRKGHP